MKYYKLNIHTRAAISKHDVHKVEYIRTDKITSDHYQGNGKLLSSHEVDDDFDVNEFVVRYRKFFDTVICNEITEDEFILAVEIQ